MTAALRYADGSEAVQTLLKGGSRTKPDPAGQYKIVRIHERKDSVPLQTLAASQGLPCDMFLRENAPLAPKVRDMCSSVRNAPPNPRCRCFAVRHGGTADRVDVFRVLLDADDDARLTTALEVSRIA